MRTNLPIKRRGSQKGGRGLVPSVEEVEAVIRSVDGVAEASVGVVPGTSRGRLRLRLAKDADGDVVSHAVADRLRERFGIEVDPATIRPTPATNNGGVALADGSVAAEPPEPSPAASNGQVRSFRPAIRDLSVEIVGLDAHVRVVLADDDRVVHGELNVPATEASVLRGVARATLLAVDQLLDGQIRTDLDFLDEGAESGSTTRVTVGVTVLTTAGAERLLGIARIKDDGAEKATLRATLDAVNRRLALEITAA